MRVFVTGASGWIGSAVVPELLANGHTVTGLARSDAAAGKISALGAEVVRGDLSDLEVLAAQAAGSDGVVHLGYRHDLSLTGDMEAAAMIDGAAIGAMADALAGTDRPLAIASGVAGLTPGRVVTERDRPEPFPGPGKRLESERTLLAAADRGVRGVCVRFAPTVHGAGDQGFVRMLVDADRDAGEAGYLRDGDSRWSAVHRSDCARLLRLAIESAPAGSVLHAVGEEGVATREIAESIGRVLGIPTVGLDPEQAADRFGFLAHILALDCPASSTLTRELVGWTPTGPTVAEDLASGAYTG